VAHAVAGDEDRDAFDDRERAALTAEHAGVDLAFSPLERRVVDQRQSRAAERATENVEKRGFHWTGNLRSSIANLNIDLQIDRCANLLSRFGHRQMATSILKLQFED
jgi:hypothetical protein